MAPLISRVGFNRGFGRRRYVSTSSSYTGLAAPILNTNGTGQILTSGVRNDPNASYLQLALPMTSQGGRNITDDVSPTGRVSSIKTVTNYNATANTSVTKFYGGSTRFQRTSPQQYFEIPAFLTSSSTFTFEIWLYMTDSPASGDGFTLFGDANAAYAGSVMASSLGYVDGIQADIGTYFPQVAISAPTCRISPNQWYHYALSCNSGTLTSYLNGISQGSVSGVSFGNAGLTYRIGANDRVDYGGAIRNFGGYLQDHRVYLGIAKYTSNFTP